MAEWVSELIAVAGYDSAVLVGHSMGSLIALELAAQIPDRVDRLVLTGTAAALPVNDRLQSSANANERRAHEMIQGWSLAARSKLGGHRSPGLWTQGHLLQTSLNAGDDVLATDLRACHEYADGPAAAAAVRCPVLVVTGEEDRMVARDGTTQLLHLLGDNARTVEIASGHSMMIESPDAFLDALIEFLQQ
jgi:pimeloyl-ACP methyl ester carboxylesterase